MGLENMLHLFTITTKNFHLWDPIWPLSPSAGPLLSPGFLLPIDKDIFVPKDT